MGRAFHAEQTARTRTQRKSGHVVVDERPQERTYWVLMESHLYAEPDRKREGHDDEEQACEDKKPLTGS